MSKKKRLNISIYSILFIITFTYILYILHYNKVFFYNETCTSTVLDPLFITKTVLVATATTKQCQKRELKFSVKGIVVICESEGVVDFKVRINLCHILIINFLEYEVILNGFLIVVKSVVLFKLIYSCLQLVQES